MGSASVKPENQDEPRTFAGIARGSSRGSAEITTPERQPMQNLTSGRNNPSNLTPIHEVLSRKRTPSTDSQKSDSIASKVPQIGAEIPRGTFRFDEFCARVQIHGIADYYEAQTKVAKMFWMFAILLFLSIFASFTYKCIDEYFTNPVVTTVSIAPKNSIHFPSILACPTNSINFTHAQTVLEPKKLNSLQKYLPSGSSELFDEDAGDWRSLFRRSIPNDRHNISVKEMEDLLTTVSFEPWEVFNRCQFNGEDLSCRQGISKVVDREFGVCYLVQVNKTQKVSGVGLRVLINLHSDIYDESNPNLLSGVVVFVDRLHGSSKFQGVLVGPGTYAQLSLSIKEKRLVNVPRSRAPQRCVDRFNSPRQRFFDTEYSREVCHLDCTYRQVHQLCACIPVTRTRHILKSDYWFLPVCERKQYAECLGKVMLNSTLKNEAQKCHSQCHVPCEHDVHSVESSQLSFPSHAYQSQILKETASLQNLLSSSPDIPTYPLHQQKRSRLRDYQYSKHSHIFLDIGYKEMESMQILQSEAITLNTLISNIGGQIGLWLGASMFTVLQFGVFMLNCCETSLYKRSRNKHVNHDVAINAENHANI